MSQRFVNLDEHTRELSSMESHVLNLVGKLKYGVDSRSGFDRDIQSAVGHAAYLERECARLRNEVREMEKGMALRFSAMVRATCEMIPESQYFADRIRWHMPSFTWNMILPPYQGIADEKMWRRICRSPYRELLKQFRTSFERTFPAHSPGGGRERGL